MRGIIKPKPLPPGGTIAIVSPSSPQRDEGRLDRGIAYLEGKGYRVVVGKSARRSWGGYLAGDDFERRSDLESMFANPMVDAIFCARGGYGVTRFLDELEYQLIRRNPKILVAFSDGTALNSALLRRSGLITFSGALPSVDMADTFNPESEAFFWRMMESTEPIGPVEFEQELHFQGTHGASGPLVCGNLALFSALCGTSHFPDLTGAVFLCEDIGEDPYKIDRMLTQLRSSGHLSKVAGLAFGQFTPPMHPSSPLSQRSVEEILVECANLLNVPMVMGLHYGHQAHKLTLPYGVRCSIDPLGKTFSIDEAACAE